MPDDVDERLSRRFQQGEEKGEDTEADSRPDESSREDMTSGTSQTESTSQAPQKAQNIKKEWNVRSFYLSDELDSELTTAFKRLDLELSEADAGMDLKKTRHFYPLLVELGLERLDEMEITEVTERLED